MGATWLVVAAVVAVVVTLQPPCGMLAGSISWSSRCAGTCVPVELGLVPSVFGGPTVRWRWRHRDNHTHPSSLIAVGMARCVACDRAGKPGAAAAPN